MLVSKHGFCLFPTLRTALKRRAVANVSGRLRSDLLSDSTRLLATKSALPGPSMALELGFVRPVHGPAPWEPCEYGCLHDRFRRRSWPSRYDIDRTGYLAQQFHLGLAKHLSLLSSRNAASSPSKRCPRAERSRPFDWTQLWQPVTSPSGMRCYWYAFVNSLQR